MTRDEILNDSDYLSACVMKHMWRGELDRASTQPQKVTG